MRLILLILVLFGLQACQTMDSVRYQPFSQSPEMQDEIAWHQQTVWFELKDEFDRILPDCVMIIPNETTPDPVMEVALARHAFSVFPKVYSANQIMRYSRKQALDPNKSNELKQIGAKFSCHTALSWTYWSNEGINVGVWAQKRAGLHLTLTSLDGKLLWQAKHSAVRSQGALPTSPLGVLSGALLATQLTMNEDVDHSLIDDALRRMVLTLPDMHHGY